MAGRQVQKMPVDSTAKVVHCVLPATLACTTANTSGAAIKLTKYQLSLDDSSPEALHELHVGLGKHFVNLMQDLVMLCSRFTSFNVHAGHLAIK